MTPKVFQLTALLPNFAGLAGVQLANALVPIIVFPYALYQLGAVGYAELVMAEAVSVLVTTAVLYSFEIEGVSRGVDLKHRDDRAGMAQLANDIFWARLFIWMACSALALAGASLFSFAAVDTLAGWLLVSLGNIFYSNCIYQAHEQNFRLGVITLLARLASILLVFLLPIAEYGPASVSVAVGAAYLLGGFLAAANLTHEFKIVVGGPSLGRMRHAMIGGWTIFLGNVSVIFYRDVNVLVLGALGAPANAIASYSIAEKFVKLVQAVVRPVTQFLFPRAVAAIRGFHAPNRQALFLVFGTIRIQWLLLGVIIAGLSIVAAAASRFSPDAREMIGIAGEDVVIMLPAVFLGVANFMLGSVGLNTLSDRTAFLRALVVTGIASISGLFVLMQVGVSHAAAISFTSAEAILLLLIVRRYVRSA